MSWLLDDFPHFEYYRVANRSNQGLSAPSKVEEIWRGEFDFMYQEIPNGVYTLTMHPQVIGRGHRMLMLERLIDYFAAHDGVRFTTLATRPRLGARGRGRTAAETRQRGETLVRKRCDARGET